MPRLQAVFIEEQTLDDPARFAGTFAAWVRPGPGQVGERVDGLSLDAAVAWGRDRAGIVLVRFGHRRSWWSARMTPHSDYPAWPPPDVPALVERPFPPRNYSEADEALEWAVTLWLQPPVLFPAPTREQERRWREAVVAAAADARSSWDSDCIDNFLEDVRAAGPDAESLFTMWPPAYRVFFVIEASSAREAEQIAAAACEPPEGFEIRWSARPADVDDA